MGKIHQGLEKLKLENYFKDKKIIITGAASGIGQGLAEVLYSWGSKLALLDIQEMRQQEGMDTYKVDVTDASAMTLICEKIIKDFGRVDLVIAAAGVGGINPATCFSLKLDQKTMKINYFGTVNTMVPLIEHFKEHKRGHLVGICSLAAFRGLPQAGSYCASKAAQMTLLESFRLDLKSSGVHVSCIHPGFVTTPMTEHDEFQMPFKATVGESTNLILKAIYDKKSQMGYPWPMHLLSRLNKLLPNFLHDFLMQRISPTGNSAPKIFSAYKEGADEGSLE